LENTAVVDLPIITDTSGMRREGVGLNTESAGLHDNQSAVSFDSDSEFFSNLATAPELPGLHWRLYSGIG
jgi:hypothetical protein